MTGACVQNTFISWPVHASSATRRNKSLPRSFGSALEAKINPTLEVNAPCDDANAMKMPAIVFGDLKSDDSTQSDGGCTEELSDCTASYDAPVEMPITDTAWDAQGFDDCCEVCGVGYYPMAVTWTSPAAWDQQGGFSPQSASTPLQRPSLNSKARVFEPSQALSKVNVDCHSHVAEVVGKAKSILERCDGVNAVDVTQGLDGWTLSVAPSPEGHGRRGLETLVAYAKAALCEAAETTGTTYVLGYSRDAVAFPRQPQGFTAQLAVQENAKEPCWALLRYASCKYGETCCKEHPALQVPVRVFVENAIFSGPRSVIQYYKGEFANFMVTVAAILSRCPSVEAQALVDQEGDAWYIDMSIRKEDFCLKENYIKLAKNAFMETMQHSQLVRVMGTGKTPFITKSDGFVTMLGEMADKSLACWDIYQHGCCWREGGWEKCQWQHPQCIMPVNVVVRAMASPLEAQE